MSSYLDQLKEFFDFGDNLTKLLEDENVSDEEKLAALNHGNPSKANIICPVVCAPMALWKCSRRFTCKQQQSKELTVGKYTAMREVKEAKEIRSSAMFVAMLLCVGYGFYLTWLCIHSPVVVNINYSTMFKDNQEVDVNPGLPSLAVCGISDIGSFFQAAKERQFEFEFVHSIPGVYEDVRTDTVTCYNSNINEEEFTGQPTLANLKKDATKDARCDPDPENEGGNGQGEGNGQGNGEEEEEEEEEDNGQVAQGGKRRILTQEENGEGQGAGESEEEPEGGEEAGPREEEEEESSEEPEGLPAPKLNVDLYYDGQDCVLVYVNYMAMTAQKDIFTMTLGGIDPQNQPSHGALIWPNEPFHWPNADFINGGLDTINQPPKYTFEYGGTPFKAGTSHMIDFLFSVSRRGDSDSPGNRDHQEETMTEVYTYSQHGRFVSDYDDSTKYGTQWRIRMLDSNVATYWYSWKLDAFTTAGTWIGFVSGFLGAVAFATPFLLLGFTLPFWNCEFKGYAPHVSFELKLLEDVNHATAVNKLLGTNLDVDEVEMCKLKVLEQEGSYHVTTPEGTTPPPQKRQASLVE